MKVYICGTDARYHIPDDADGINIYFSVESMKERCSCWRECGITELELDCENPVVIEPENWELAMKNSRTGEQISWDCITQGPKNILKAIKDEVKSTLWGIKSLISMYYYRLRYFFSKR